MEEEHAWGGGRGKGSMLLPKTPPLPGFAFVSELTSVVEDGEW
jgi:hypothetical protein